MRFTPLDIAGAFQIDVEPVTDHRGHFARWYDAEVFRAQGLELTDTQGAVSHNVRSGTLRGLHFIPEADGEAKLVRCVRGRIFDVIVDLRPASPTFCQWQAVELSAQTHTTLYFPRGCAHGFITLEDHCDVTYQFSMPHRPGLERGLRWNDPSIAIAWPNTPNVMSDRDKALPLFEDLKLA